MTHEFNIGIDEPQSPEPIALRLSRIRSSEEAALQAYNEAETFYKRHGIIEDAKKMCKKSK